MKKLLGSSVVVIGLLLAGPQKASADQLFYCKNPAVTNQPLVLYTTSPTCPPGTTVTSINVSGPPGSALGASQFRCTGTSDKIASGTPISGVKGYTAGVTFGSSGVTYASPGPTFVLQPGIYQVQLNLPVMMDQPNGGQTFLAVDVLVNGNVVDTAEGLSVASNTQSAFSVIGFSLLQISGPNTVVGFNVDFSTGTVFLDPCKVIFTRLQ